MFGACSWNQYLPSWPTGVRIDVQCKGLSHSLTHSLSHSLSLALSLSLSLGLAVESLSHIATSQKNCLDASIHGLAVELEKSSRAASLPCCASPPKEQALEHRFVSHEGPTTFRRKMIAQRLQNLLMLTFHCLNNWQRGRWHAGSSRSFSTGCPRCLPWVKRGPCQVLTPPAHVRKQPYRIIEVLTSRKAITVHLNPAEQTKGLLSRVEILHDHSPRARPMSL